jgi:hypothetical protein
MNRKIIALPVIVIIAFVIGFIYLIKGCLSSHNTYGVVGRPAVSADGKTITVVVAVSEATSYQVNGGYRRTTYNTSYWLKQYETATGKLLQQKKIDSHAEKDNLLALCYGGFADKIWVHTYGLKAYSLSNLDEVVNEEKLAAANGFNKNEFAKEERFIDEAVTEGHIIFTAESGDKYKIDLATEKITPYNDTQSDKEMAIQKILRRYNHNNGFTGSRCDTINGKMYMLAKDSTDAAELQPTNADAEPVYKKLNLYTSSFTQSSYGNHSVFSKKSIVQMQGCNYINGMFVTDNGTTIKPPSPGLLLIMHNNIVGHAARSLITNIDNTGHSLWQCNTGISTKIINCVSARDYCIVSGNKDAITAPHIGCDMLCVVNLQNGTVVKLALEK